MELTSTAEIQQDVGRFTTQSVSDLSRQVRRASLQQAFVNMSMLHILHCGGIFSCSATFCSALNVCHQEEQDFVIFHLDGFLNFPLRVLRHACILCVQFLLLVQDQRQPSSARSIAARDV